ncbi:MAG TPA: DUF3267 domain-containing protein [Ktedonobacteraceae bacterium]|nr:DUF3267 domain-containing protein [Ktedonobacteraceae bacterium]
MRASTTLPQGYTSKHTIDLTKDRHLQVQLSIGSLILFIVFGLLFWAAAIRLGNYSGSNGRLTLTLPLLLLGLLALVLLSAIVILLHEGLHGICYLFFTRSRPVFGFKGLYAYAAAPGWYIPRPQFIVTGLAPLIVLSLLGLIVMPILPISLLPALVFSLTVNASGAVGDMYMIWITLRQPAKTLVLDFGDGITFYTRGYTS